MPRFMRLRPPSPLLLACQTWSICSCSAAMISSSSSTPRGCDQASSYSCAHAAAAGAQQQQQQSDRFCTTHRQQQQQHSGQSLRQNTPVALVAPAGRPCSTGGKATGVGYQGWPERLACQMLLSVRVGLEVATPHPPGGHGRVTAAVCCGPAGPGRVVVAWQQMLEIRRAPRTPGHARAAGRP